MSLKFSKYFLQEVSDTTNSRRPHTTYMGFLDPQDMLDYYRKSNQYSGLDLT